MCAQRQGTHQIEVHGHVMTHMSHCRLRCRGAVERHLTLLSVHLDSAPQHVLAATCRLSRAQQEAPALELLKNLARATQQPLSYDAHPQLEDACRDTPACLWQDEPEGLRPAQGCPEARD